MSVVLLAIHFPSVFWLEGMVCALLVSGCKAIQLQTLSWSTTGSNQVKYRDLIRLVANGANVL